MDFVYNTSYNNAEMDKKYIFRLFNVLVILLLLVLLVPAQPGQAQSYSAYDLIAAVNDLRAQNGLTAYTVDSGLMAYAQTHADYMASTGLITHVRADGSRPRDLGLQENIAMGSNYSPSDVIYTMWTDAAHWNNLVGVPGGTIGGGVAQQGSFIYYSMVIRPDNSVPPPTANPNAPPVNPNATAGAPQDFSAVTTSTPMPDGSVVHPVQFGQSLWAIAIAYNLKIDAILEMNGLPANSVIQSGQLLIMQLPYTVTPTPTITSTNPPVTRTPTMTATPKTPTPTRTITPTLTPTPKPFLPEISMAPKTKQILGLSMVVVCAAGLLFVTVAAFLKKKS